MTTSQVQGFYFSRSPVIMRGKLTRTGISKRISVETIFQVQQEQLNVINAKFRDGVNQHLQDCRSTLEGLEAHQIEFKGTVERQKASHKKLLLQVEEAIEALLNDAQRRITNVHKVWTSEVAGHQEPAFCNKI